MNQFSTIPEMFLSVCNKFGNREVYSYKEEGEWKSLTFQQVRDMVETIAFGLTSIGVERGDRVAILSYNTPQWAMSDYAITSLGAVTVTVYHTLISPQIQYILDDSESKVIFVEDMNQAQKVFTFLDKSKFIKNIIIMNNERADQDSVLTFDALIQKGEKEKESKPYDFEERVATVKSDDLLTLVYTSGTTGNPKGVMLSHDNLVSNVKGVLKLIPIDENDIFLSFLPLSHVFERMAGHYTGFSVGGSTYYAESMESVSENFGEARPTIMCSVPRLYEKMYSRVLDKVANDPPLRQKIFWWAVGVGQKAVKYRQKNQPLPGGLKFKFSIADKLVFSKLKARLGGRLRFFVSGAAPLSQEIGEFFAAADIIILEGYGLTETSPVMTANCLESFKFGTVGMPLPEVEVKIADDGEILNRGPNTMMGYFKNKKATDEVIDDDGWFYTGDIGEFDEEGFLKITDRKKNLIVTSGGKNVAPAPLENSLQASKYVEQCLVIGDRRKFISALVVPSFEALEEWSNKEGIDYQNRDELIFNSEIITLYENEVSKAMEDFAQFETVKKIALLPQEWTIEAEELTPTFKVKRRVVEEKYKDKIDSLYEETG